MRLGHLLLGVSAVWSPGCTRPNPAFFDAGSEAGSSSGTEPTVTSGSSTSTGAVVTGADASTGDTSESSSGSPETATDPVITGTSTTATATTADGSTGVDGTSTGAVGSTGEGTSTGETTGGSPCDDAPASYPDLEVLVHTAVGVPIACGGDTGPQFTARAHALGPGKWKLERCAANTCLNNLPCASDVYELTIAAGEPSVLPTLQDQGCYYFGVLGREPADPQTCRARIVRVAEAAGKPSLFAAGIDANDAPPAWRTITGLHTSAGTQAQSCGDEAPCGIPAGIYALDVYWGKSAEPVTVGPGETLAGMFKLLAANNSEVAVAGTFYNLRSYALAEPDCATSVQWKWVWLADALGG